MNLKIYAPPLLLFALLLHCKSNAQVKVFPSDKVQVGPLWWPSFPSTQQLFINGGLEVREFPGSGIYLKNYSNTVGGIVYNDPSIVSHFNYGGWVGTPGQAMYAVYTNVLYAAGVQITSDERLKTNIKPLSSSTSLQKILSLKAYTYDFSGVHLKNIDEKKRAILISFGRNQIGFMAQEVNEIVPQIVKQDTASGDYSVNYTMLIPILVEAIKEQQQKINLLVTELELLKQR